MKINIIEIQFERDESGSVPFNKFNTDQLVRYVLPIINQNEGWDTKELTTEEFFKDPEKWRDDIDATIQKVHSTHVFIAMSGTKPVGLLMYVLEDLFDTSKGAFQTILSNMINSKNNDNWQLLIKDNLIDRKFLDKHFDKLKKYLVGKNLYSKISIVLISELQGKRSGVSDQLYKIMDNGFIFGRTSTPQAVAKRRQVFKHSLFFPLYLKELKTFEDFALFTIASARSLSKYLDNKKKYKLGVFTYSLFLLRDKDKYMKLSKSFLDNGKITELDYKRLEYILSIKKAQAAIISTN